MPSANLPHPTHPVVLTDGITTLGLNLCGNDGVNDITAISSTPYPRTGLKITQGDTEYSDQELPFASTHQDDFSGGRAAEKFEDDKSRLADEYRCETRFPGVVFPGAQERYAPITTTVFGENWFTSPTRMNDKIKGRYVARKFVASATGTIKACLLMLDTTSELLYNLSAQIWSHNAVGDKPNVELGWLLFNGGFTTHGIYPYLFLDTDGVAVTSGTTYWLVLSDTTEARNIVYDSDPTKSGYIKTSTDAITWATHAGDLYFRLTIAPTNAQAHFFMYKGAQYCLGDGYLRINGDRGVADASAATTLQDGSKAWTADEFIGAVVYVFRGTGAGQYRAISTNGTDFLGISLAWDTIPDTTSEYVILGANSWRNVLAATGYVQAALAGEFIYMAAPGAVVKRYNCYNSGGTYTERNADETVYADKILATYDSALRKWYLWGVAPNDTYHASSVWRMCVPPLWAALYRDRGTIDTWSSPWDDLVVSNVTVAKSATEDDTIALTVAAGFTTGMLAAKNISAIDITGGTQFSFAVKSSVLTASGDVKLFFLNDQLSGFGSGRFRPPDMIYEFDGTTTYTDLAAARDGDTGTVSTVSIITTDSIYIGSTRPFDRISVNIGTTANAVASTLTAEYTGSVAGSWASVTITDGTTAGGATFAVDGVISFTPPADWESFTVNTNTLYWIRLKTSANWTASVTIIDIVVYLSPASVNLPILAAGVWQWVNISATLLSRPWPDDSAITSIGLYQNTDLGAQVISLRGSLLLTETAPEYIAIQTRKRITNLVASGEERTNPWVIAEGELFEIQTQNANAVVKIPLDELETLGSPDMGLGACTNDVYLYFSLGKRVERYNNGLLENLGPDLDNGLPAWRAGRITQLISLPGGSVGAVIRGAKQDSILIRKNGWHEVYRTPLTMTTTSPVTSWSATRIGGATVQEIPGVGTVMWIQQGGSILKMNFPLSESEAGGDYLYGSSFITPWISMGMLDVQKRLMTLKLYSENLRASPQDGIYMFYQVETGDFDTLTFTDWHAYSQLYTTSPFEIKLVHREGVSDDYAQSCRRVRFKFMFTNQTFSRLLRLRAWVLNAILSLDVRYLHTLRVRIDDDPQDLTGKSDHTTQAENTKAQLVTWMSSPPVVLTMYTMYATNTAKSVIVMPFSFKPYKVRMGSGADAKEALVVDVPVLEVA